MITVMIVQWIGIGIFFLAIFKLWRKSEDSSASVEEKKVKEVFRQIMNELFSATDTVFAKGVDELRNLVDLASTVDSLRKEKIQLKIDKSKRDEDFNRERREIEHKIGLERVRQKQELELQKREITIKVREEALEKDRERFTEQMKFHQDRFEKEITYQRELVEKMVGSFEIKVKHNVNAETSR